MDVQGDTILISLELLKHEKRQLNIQGYSKLVIKAGKDGMKN